MREKFNQIEHLADHEAYDLLGKAFFLIEFLLNFFIEDFPEQKHANSLEYLTKQLLNHKVKTL